MLFDENKEHKAFRKLHLMTIQYFLNTAHTLTLRTHSYGWTDL